MHRTWDGTSSIQILIANKQSRPKFAKHSLAWPFKLIISHVKVIKERIVSMVLGALEMSIRIPSYDQTTREYSLYTFIDLWPCTCISAYINKNAWEDLSMHSSAGWRNSSIWQPNCKIIRIQISKAPVHEALKLQHWAKVSNQITLSLKFR